MDRAEIHCAECSGELRVGELKEGSFGDMETIRFLDLVCRQCDIVTRSHYICELLIVKLAKLTAKGFSLAEKSHNQLMVRTNELKDLVSELRPLVAGTSFALGILYRELADIYEVLGRMNKCAESCKMLIPVVE